MSPFLHRRGRARLAHAAALGMLATAIPGSAATDDWVGHLAISPPPLHRVYDGVFSDAVNWSTGVVPGAADTAEFNAAQTYTVTFSTSPTNAALTVAGGAVTFVNGAAIATYTVGSVGVSGDLTLSDFLLTSNGAVSVSGSGASLTVMSDSSGAGGSQLLSGNISVGPGLGSGGSTLTVEGPRAVVTQSGAATLGIGGGLLLGGTGTLQVQNGATFNTGSGAATVSRGGSIGLSGGTLQENGNLTINAGRITGDLHANFRLAIGSQFNLLNGGRADFANSISFTANSTTIDGSGSQFNNTAYTYVGSGGHSSAMVWQNGATGTLAGLFVGGTTDPNTTGTVFVQSGASVTSNNTGVGDFNAAGQVGTLTVTGSGSTLNLNGFTVGGFASSGTLNVNSGGVLNSSAGSLVGAMGHLSIAGGTFNGSDTTVRGSLQSDATGSLVLPAGSHLAVSSGGHVDLNGNVTAPGAQITVDGAGSHFNMSRVLSLGLAGSSPTGTFTLTGGATANLAGGLLLGSIPSTFDSNGAATVGAGSQLTVGDVGVATDGLSGQTGMLTVTGAGAGVTVVTPKTLTVGAAGGSTGLVHIDNGGTLNAAADILRTGTVSVSGGTFATSGLTVNRGTVQSDSTGTVTFAESAMVMVQGGGTVDLNGPVSMQAAIVTVSDAASHFNVAQPVQIGSGVTGQNGILNFVNGGTGSFPGGLSLLESFNTTGTVLVQMGGQMTTGDLSIGADGGSTNSTPQLLISGAGSTVTQSGAAALTIGTFANPGTSYGLLKVQNGGTFTSGTGPTVVSVNSTLQVQGGTYNANGDITFSASTFQQDAAGRFVLAPGKTITFKNSAMVNINGSFTGGNVDNEVSMDLSGGNMAVQAFDGQGDVNVAAGAHLTADHLRQGSLMLNGNAAIRTQPTADSDASASTLDRLTIQGAGQLDLSDNQLSIHYAAGQSPANTIRSYLVTGYHNGAWDGPGIVTSAADHAHALGFADSADGVVAGLGANTVLVKFTLVGDLNLDGQVNFSDLLALAQHYGQPSGNWDQGDFNYDGAVNFADLLGLAQNYGRTLAAARLNAFLPSLGGDLPEAVAQVPEPATAGMVMTIGAVLRRRTRRGLSYPSI